MVLAACNIPLLTAFATSTVVEDGLVCFVEPPIFSVSSFFLRVAFRGSRIAGPAFELADVAQFEYCVVDVSRSSLPSFAYTNKGEVTQLTTKGCKGGVVKVGRKDFCLDAVAVMDDYLALDYLAWYVLARNE